MMDVFIGACYLHRLTAQVALHGFGLKGGVKELSPIRSSGVVAGKYRLSRPCIVKMDSYNIFPRPTVMSEPCKTRRLAEP